MARAIKGRELRKMYEGLGARETVSLLREGFEAREFIPDDFSLRELAEHLVPDGREWISMMNPRHSGDGLLQEAAGVVDTAAFANITGQIVYSAMLERFQSPQFVFTPLVRNVPTQFSGEKIPGIGGIGDMAAIVPEGKPYPQVGLTEDWINTPQTFKRGNIIPITKEAIFFDRTNQILDEARKIGEYLGYNKETRIIDAFVDEGSTVHRYNWRNSIYATYQATTPWLNLKASNALLDWTNLDAVEQLFNNMVDPNTGLPILVMAQHLVVTPQLAHVAARILNATSISLQSTGFATMGALTATHAPNPVGNSQAFSAPYKLITSRILPTRMATDTSWFLGDIGKTVQYMENFPLAVQQAPSNSEPEFTADIVMRFKASERGAAAVVEPRATVKSTA